MKRDGSLKPKSVPHYTEEECARAGRKAQEMFRRGCANSERFHVDKTPDSTARFTTLPKLIYTYLFNPIDPGSFDRVAPAVLAQRIRHYRRARSQYFDSTGHARSKNPAYLTTLFCFPPQGDFFAALEKKGVNPEPLILQVMTAGIAQWNKRTGFEAFGLILNLNQGCPHGHPVALTVSGEGRLLRPSECKRGGTNRLPNLGPSHLGVWRRQFFGLEVPASDINAIRSDWQAREERAGKKILDADVAQSIDEEFLRLIQAHPEWRLLWDECLEDYARKVRESAQFQFRTALDIALRSSLPFFLKVHGALSTARRGNVAQVHPDIADALVRDGKNWTINPTVKSDVSFLLQHARDDKTKSVLTDLLDTEGRKFDPATVLMEVMNLAQAERPAHSLGQCKFILRQNEKLILRPTVLDDLRRYSPDALDEIEHTLALVDDLVSEQIFDTEKIAEIWREGGAEGGSRHLCFERCRLAPSLHFLGWEYCEGSSLDRWLRVELIRRSDQVRLQASWLSCHRRG